jgi:hypothetical protein
MVNLVGVTVLTLVSAVAGILWGGYVYYRSQGWKPTWNGIGNTTAALFWAVPIAAVMGYVFVRTARQVATPVPQDKEASTALIEDVATTPTEPVALRDGVPSSGASQDSDAVETTGTVNVPTAEKPAAMRPAWVDSPQQDGMVVVVGKPNLDREQAEQNARYAAWTKTIATLHRERTFEGNWRPERGDIKPLLMGEPYIEPVVSRTGSSTFTTYRVHLLLDLSKSGQRLLYPVWEQHLVHSRLWVLGGWLGMLTLISGTIAAYLRLDDLTNGMYRLRLKFAATSLIVSGGFVAAVLTTA